MSSMIAKSEVRARITTELALLRDLFEALIVVARSVERDERQRSTIRDVLEQVSVAVDRHFRYEEEVIAPLLRELDAWGPVRVEHLFQEHADQRSVLGALADDARDGVRSLDDLADEIVWFFRRFEQEMTDAELRLLAAESLGAEPSVDQIDG